MQLVYGEDGLDPVGMEARDGGPVDFSRTAQVVCAVARRPPGGAPPPRSRARAPDQREAVDQQQCFQADVDAGVPEADGRQGNELSGGDACACGAAARHSVHTTHVCLNHVAGQAQAYLTGWRGIAAEGETADGCAVAGQA